MASTPDISAPQSEAMRPPLTRRSGRSGADAATLARRIVPSLVAGGTACALLVYMAYETGGYFPEVHLKAAWIAMGTVAVLLLFHRPPWKLTNSALVALAGLCALSAWTGLSSLWSSLPDVALEDFQRNLLYVALFGLGLIAAGSGRYSRHLMWACLGVIAAVVIGGLLSRLRPDLVTSAYSGFEGYRLDHPLSYWNAFGAMGAMGLVLAVGLAGDPRSHLALRSGAAALTVPLGVAAYLSFSRGAWLAFFVGMAVLLALGAHRRSQAAALAVCGTALVIAVGRLSTFEGLTEFPRAGAGQAAEGRTMLATIIVLAAAAGAALAFISGRWLPADLRALGDRLTRGIAIAAIAVAALAGAGYYLVHASQVEGGTAQALIDAEDWLDREWDEFMRPAAFTAGSGTERLTSARGTRSDLYRVAIDGFEGHPLWGDGSGGFEVRFAFDREVPEKVRDAHSLYLETLGELGLVGILSLLVFVGAVGWAAVRARVRPGGLSRAQVAAAAAASSVYFSHAAVDWDWQMPALTGVALLLAATVFPTGRTRRARSFRRRDPYTAAATVTSAGRRTGR